MNLVDVIPDDKRAEFWAELDAAHAALEADPEAWKAWQDEIAEWDVMLMDGLED
jgi:hypothetical protein